MILRAIAVLAIALTGFAAADTDPWKAADVIHVAEVAAQVQSGHPPHLFMVGPRILYNGAHIPGAEYAGQTNSQEGIEHLLRATAPLDKTAEIVIYCGCCPMPMCPNIRPAFTVLKAQGYENVKVLEIPTNLKTDWTDKGYPVEKGSVPKTGT